MTRVRSSWPLVLAALGWIAMALATSGCASAPGPAPRTMPMASASSAEVPRGEEPAMPLADDPAQDPVEEPVQELAVATVDGAAGGEDVTEGGEPEAIPELPTSAEALQQALEWVTEGLRQFESGEDEEALANLNAARSVLLGAHLPEAMQERGLSALNCFLPPELAQHDVESVARQLDTLAQASAGDAEQAEHRYIEREVRRILRRFGDASPNEERLDVFVREVDRYVHFYRDKNREFFERAYSRKHKYWPLIEQVFEQRRIPIELGYLALVESGFNPRARSYANARGLWQFVPGTGRRYQLRHTEDFYDVAKSTQAAAEYLLDLIGIFGSPSFLLATASYNAGEGRIMDCLRKLDDPFGQRSFWAIRACLPRETQEYVPRIMAAAVIGSDPARFGFDVLSPEQAAERYDVVTLPRPTSLTTLAREAGVDLGELRAANSDLPPGASSTPVRNFPLYLPKGGAEHLGAELTTATEMVAAAAAEAESTGTENTREEREEATTYRVRRGDTLSTIASRQGVSYREIAAWNDLKPPYRLSVGQRLTLYAAGSEPHRVLYTVQPGNTLWDIATIFAVPYRDIMGWNNLRSSRLRAGQKLVIHPPRRFKAVQHTVRRGDTVAAIARRYGVAVETVLTANGLGPRSVIHTGQRLLVYTT